MMSIKPDYKKLIFALDEINNNNKPTIKLNIECSKECIDKRIKTINEEFDLYNKKTKNYIVESNIIYIDPNIFNNKTTKTYETTKKDSPTIDKNKSNSIETKKIEKTKYLKIEREVNNIDDLLNLINDYPYSEDTEYNINLEGLHKIHTSLLDLKNMIGMT